MVALWPGRATVPLPTTCGPLTDHSRSTRRIQNVELQIVASGRRNMSLCLTTAQLSFWNRSYTNWVASGKISIWIIDTGCAIATRNERSDVKALMIQKPILPFVAYHSLYNHILRDIGCHTVNPFPYFSESGSRWRDWTKHEYHESDSWWRYWAKNEFHESDSWWIFCPKHEYHESHSWPDFTYQI
jgi:hypothetical protein